jgi:hypothetical protein
MAYADLDSAHVRPAGDRMQQALLNINRPSSALAPIDCLVERPARSVPGVRAAAASCTIMNH